MKCEEYRERIAADPSGNFDGSSHASDCDSCATYRDGMQSLDQKIARALAIDVPDLVMPDLPANDVDDKVVNMPITRRLTTPSWIAVAASVALVAVFAGRMLTSPTEFASLADEILAHLDHEPRALRPTNTAVSERRLARVVRDDVASVDNDFGLITYAQSCVINGKTIPHLVIQGEKGPVTILLMPDEMIDNAIVLDGEGVNGVILKVGRGSIAIVGERDEQLKQIEQRVIDSVEWEI